MKNTMKFFLITAALLIASASLAQSEADDDKG